MNELDKIEKLEKQLKARKRKALAKEYEKLGREFYKQSNAKSMPKAHKMIGSMSEMSEYEKLGREFCRQSNANSMSEAFEMLTKMPLSSTLTEEQFMQLKFIAGNMQWDGNYWNINNLPEVGNWLSQFRKKENEQS